MNFTTLASVSQATADAIDRAVIAIDPFAKIHVDANHRNIRIDGRLTAQQAISALVTAGCVDAVMAETFPPANELGGGNCCGCGS